MEREWQVTFFANAPVWTFGKLISYTQAPDGQQIPFLMCSTVLPLATGFVELTVAEESGTHALTLLVPTQHVLGVMHSKKKSSLGFAKVTPTQTPGTSQPGQALPPAFGG